MTTFGGASIDGMTIVPGLVGSPIGVGGGTRDVEEPIVGKV